MTKATTIIIICILAICLFGIVRINLTADTILNNMQRAEEEWQAEERKEIDEYDRLLGSLQRFAHVRKATFPDAVVEACIYTSRPMLCAAVALRESTGNHYAIGDGGDSYGMFQVQRRWWGRVPVDPYSQGQQWQRVMTVLLERHDGDIISALADYNEGREFGSAGLRYAAAVLKEAR